MSDTEEMLRSDAAYARWRKDLWAARREEAERHHTQAVADEERAEAALAARKVTVP